MSATRDDVLRRLAGRRGPRDPDLHAAWARRTPADRDRLRRTATDPHAAGHLHDDLDRALVDALARDRASRRQLDLAVPVLTALLVLSTIWGFGRAAVPDRAGQFLVAALLAAALTAVVGWRRGARLRTASREVRRVLRR